ncbi:MAG: 16S rRNA (adenine(1518)-N(6)/adenine(1519)-N(6))-dimethyltransferase RsmA [Candidatus Azambacteria bacterium]|nr:16S rRNA (adenine(1518)-N(6)/adenine(1519)-N(6))-dimethyltransferase RsmA [Candidatus Azambacteria bacterium]
MNLTNITIIKALLKRHGAKPEKYLGQHFILSKKVLAQMVAAAEIKKNDIIIEIGPGPGALTQELVKTGAKIIAIEKDPLMAKITKETLKDLKNVKIIRGDARKIEFPISNFQFLNKSQISNSKPKIKEKYKIVANLPYNVATFLIRQWLELKNPPKLMVLMIQKEVAQRITAKPRLRQGYGGQAPMNLLAISVQFYADVKIIGYVPAEAFLPKPKVDSAIIKIIPRKSVSFQTIASKLTFFKVVKAGFSQPRKQLIGNLTQKLNIPKEEILLTFKKLDISEHARAENLSLEQWISLVISLHPPLIHK